jgi:hypothetical protein
MDLELKRKTEYELKQVLLSQQSPPYTFKTRLERAMLRVYKLADDNGLDDLRVQSQNIKTKLNYISDHSNQTSDGTLKSYLYLHDDLELIYDKVSKL